MSDADEAAAEAAKIIANSDNGSPYVATHTALGNEPPPPPPPPPPEDE